jgi:hypothetical protein
MKMKTKKKIIAFCILLCFFAFIIIEINFRLQLKTVDGSLYYEVKQLNNIYLRNKEYPNSHCLKYLKQFKYKKIDKNHCEIAGKERYGLFDIRDVKATETGIWILNSSNTWEQKGIVPVPYRDI